MSAKDNTVFMGEEQNGPTPQPAQAAPQPQPGNATQQTYSNWTGVQNNDGSDLLAQMFGGSGILNPGAEAVVNFMEQITEIVKNLGPQDKERFGDNITFTEVSNPGAPGSVCVMHRLINGDVYYSVFVITKTFGKVANQIKSFGNRSIEIDQTAFSLFDNVYKQAVEGILKKFYSTNLSLGSKVNLVASSVVPASADTSKPEVVRVYFAAAISQMNALLRRSRSITAVQIRQNNLILTSNYQITPDATYSDLTGTPELGDFGIDLIIGTKKVQQNNFMGSNLLDQPRDNQYTLSKVVGYVDFMPIPGANVRQPVYSQYQQMQPPHQYNPVFVVTHNATLGSSNNVADDTLLTQLLGLVAMVPLIEENKYRWICVFESFSNENHLSLGDFGYQSNPWLAPNESFVPQPIQVLPTEQVAFNRSQQAQSSSSARTVMEIATTYVSGNALIALDCTLGEPLYRLKDIIGNAIVGSQQEAAVLGTLDAFFEGQDAAGNKYSFSAYWKTLKDQQGRQESIVLRGINGEDTKTILHAGHYNSDTGVRDARSLRLLTALAATKGQNVMLEDFIRNRFYGRHSAESIHESRVNLQAFISQVEITGITYRYYINPRFIQAIGYYLQLIGIAINVQGLNDMSVNSYLSNNIVIANQNLAIQGGGFNTWGNQGFTSGGNLNIQGGDTFNFLI